MPAWACSARAANFLCFRRKKSKKASGFEWNMGLFGSVTYEGVFNRKATTLTLYKKRHTPYHWMIMYEPLSIDPNIFFDDLHAFIASCPAIMLGSVI